MNEITKANYKSVSKNESILGLIYSLLMDEVSLVATDSKAIGEYVCSSDFGMVQIVG